MAGAAANATASGCTSAPGNAFALNCIYVTGRSVSIKNAHSEYDVGFPPENVCRPRARFRYRKQGSRTYVVHVIKSTKCGIEMAWIDWVPPFKFADQSRFCAQQLNDKTNGRYTNYACVNILR